MRANVHTVLTIMATMLPLFALRLVSRPSRKTPKVAPPVKEKILKLNKKFPLNPEKIPSPVFDLQSKFKHAEKELKNKPLILSGHENRPFLTVI